MVVRVKELKISQITTDKAFQHFVFDDSAVEVLRKDIERRGLLVPITVWKKESEEKKKFVYILISGHHRLEAVKGLKDWETIPVSLMEFASKDEAVFASLELNSQDRFQNNKNRGWFQRFELSLEKEKLIRLHADERKKAGKKIEKGEKGDFYSVALKVVGLTSCSRSTYYGLCAVYKQLKKQGVPECVINAFSGQVAVPAPQRWKDAVNAFKTKQEDKIGAFSTLCDEFCSTDDKEGFEFNRKARAIFRDDEGKKEPVVDDVDKKGSGDSSEKLGDDERTPEEYSFAVSAFKIDEQAPDVLEILRKAVEAINGDFEKKKRKGEEYAWDITLRI